MQPGLLRCSQVCPGAARYVRGSQVCSGQGRGDSPPQSSTQTVLDPALLPLLHSVGFVGGAQHRHTATPSNTGFNTDTCWMWNQCSQLICIGQCEFTFYLRLIIPLKARTITVACLIYACKHICIHTCNYMCASYV